MKRLRARLRASRIIVASALLALAAASSLSAAEEPLPTRRFALVLGADGGGDGRARLRYASSDARSFASVMSELGGVRDDDLALIMDPSLSAFRGACQRIQSAAAQASQVGQRCEFVFYYSGHSDDVGLLLGKERLAYTELRSSLDKVPAAVRVAILDSCSSGSLTRSKGGAARPAFLFDSSTDMEGHAYITSSSAEEAAQESDRIGASFFTYYLISAMRGAADLRGEGRVTLNDAYAYAFRETLASTENTKYGPQHPNYEISLTGSGDLVFTDLRSARAGLELSEELSGKLFLRDAKGALVVELDKPEGKRMEVGLPPGKYSAVLVDRDVRMQAEVLVSAGNKAELGESSFRGLTADPTTARGIAIVPVEQAPSAPSLQLAPAVAAPARPTEKTVNLVGFPLSFSVGLPTDLSKGIFTCEEDRVVALSALMGEAHDLRGVQLSGLMNVASGDTRGFQFTSLANAVQGRMVGAQWATFANVALGGFGGVQLGAAANVAGGEAKGVQLGVVNVADSITGAQVGLVNISNHLDGATVGLVNYERGGIFSPEVLWALGANFQGDLKFGTHLSYTIVSTGFNFASSNDTFSLGIGTGYRLKVGPFFGDVDLSWRQYFSSSLGSFPRLEMRAITGFPITKTGFILGLSLMGYLPGLSYTTSGTLATSFYVEPRFILGMKF